MEVHFPPELEGKLARIAAEQGRNTESLVFEAIERLVGCDEWFVRDLRRAFPPPTEANSSSTPTSAR